METPNENTLERVDLSEDETHAPQTLAETDIISQFDEILGKNLDRLLGLRQGIEALPLNIFTVSCLILLATRETEIEGFPYLPPERYTNAGLMNDMSDMNIEHGGDLEGYIAVMGEKGYIRVENDGRLFPGSPIMKMAMLFDRIFPRMPGLNLVAYLGQMIDEVLSSRKTLRTALNQFDQMLNLHGVSLTRDADSRQRDTGKFFPHLKVSKGHTAQQLQKKIIPVDIKPSDIYSKLQTKAWAPPQHRAEIVIPSLEPEKDGAEMEAAPVVLNIRNDASDLNAKVSETPREDAGFQFSASRDPHESSGDAGETSLPDEPVPVRGYDQEFDLEPEDDDIEKKIAEFVEELSMKCPLCRTSGIVPRTTARGKSYYKCTSEECNFISWGKPYYLTCPKCENPFLIETPDSQGNMILKCPKTTCLHWQKFPWDEGGEKDAKSSAQEPPAAALKKPRRLVRKRRVVVRRKS